MPTVAPDQPGIYGSVTLWGRISTSKNWMDSRTKSRGGSLRPIWISELGWSTCTAGESDCYASTSGAALADAADPLDWRLTLGPSASGSYVAEAALSDVSTQALVGVGEDAQASYLVRAHGIALALGISHLNWLQLEDKFDGSARNFWEETAMLRTVAQGYARKQAATAYETLTAQLGNAAYRGAGPLHGYKHVNNGSAPTARFNLRFASDDARIIDLIWRNSGAETISMPLEPGYAVEVISRDGARLPFQIVNGGARFSIGGAPVYMVQSKPPKLTLNPATELAAVMAPADPALPFTVRIANEGSGQLTWQAQSSVGWATVSPTAGQARSGSIELRMQATQLKPGVYRGALKLTTSLGNREVPLRLVVMEKPYRLYVPLVGVP
ncbi:MAG: hypothetical protein HC822_12650 [Oscillochloris sp.]|nr:hypothetical protein [Oscillochloris sp.]